MSRFLLDTHAALWWWTDLPRLGPNARAIIESGSEEVMVSAASAFEIGLKWRLGKLANIADPERHYPALMARNGFVSLAIEERHAIRAGLLPGEHRDPFDRLIAAQALEEKLVLVTRDREIASFGCEVVW